MGKVLQRAGGGKVTVEGLTPDTVQSGKTVTVRQGSKVVEQVKGTYPGKIHIPLINMYAASDASPSITIDVTHYTHISFSASVGYLALVRVYYDGTAVFTHRQSASGYSFNYDDDIADVQTIKIGDAWITITDLLIV